MPIKYKGSNAAFWTKEQLLAERENALFEQKEELRKREKAYHQNHNDLVEKEREMNRREAIILDRELTLEQSKIKEIYPGILDDKLWKRMEGLVVENKFLDAVDEVVKIDEPLVHDA